MQHDLRLSWARPRTNPALAPKSLAHLRSHGTFCRRFSRHTRRHLVGREFIVIYSQWATPNVRGGETAGRGCNEANIVANRGLRAALHGPANAPSRRQRAVRADLRQRCRQRGNLGGGEGHSGRSTCIGDGRVHGCWAVAMRMQGSASPERSFGCSDAWNRGRSP